MANIDTRTKHFTATVEVSEVTSAGIVAPTSYPADGKQVTRETEQISRIVIRADTLLALRDKLQELVDTEAIF